MDQVLAFAALSLAAAVAVVAVPTFAADPAERVVAVGERLKLTEEQIAAAGPIVRVGAVRQLEVLRKYGIEDLSGLGNKRLGLRTARKLGRELDVVRGETADALAAILTDEQMATYREMQDERRREIRKRIRDAR